VPPSSVLIRGRATERLVASKATAAVMAQREMKARRNSLVGVNLVVVMFVVACFSLGGLLGSVVCFEIELSWSDGDDIVGYDGSYQPRVACKLRTW